MKTFIIYRYPKKPLNLDYTVFVPESFSFLAFFFSIFYTLYNKLWMCSLILLLCFTSINLAYYNSCITFTEFCLLRLIIMSYIGYSYSDWYQLRLKNQGYINYKIILSPSLDEAKLRFCNSEEFNQVQDIQPQSINYSNYKHY